MTPPTDGGPADQRTSDEVVLATYADAALPRAERDAAFRELVGRFQHRVFAVCVRMLGSTGDAEDATQETFVKLARGASGFRGDAQVSTWLYRIARNACTDLVRHDARRPASPVADLAEIGDPGSDDPELAAVEAGEQLRAALATLEASTRRLLLLVAVDGLSYAEVAALTDLPVGTIKSRVSRARARLGEVLADADETHGPSPATTGGGPSGEGDPPRPRGPPTSPP